MSSEKDFYNLSISVSKALSPVEAPLKSKHARSVIIATHHTKECKRFWLIIMKQPLMEQRFSAWKFFHLFHRVLREGHESALRHSITHKQMILEIGKLWSHLQDGVGNCIQAYSKFLVTKLDFHSKNLIFPASLIIDFDEIEKFALNDVNIYFQLCVEIFDYLDEIIDVQSKVFASVNAYRMSSMTPQGQCRLAPLITLIQDSHPLYNICARFMFKLHAELQNDILVGHRDRFRNLFLNLKQFYDNVRPLQYFSDLIKVPELPHDVPDFNSKNDFCEYVMPTVLLRADPEPTMDELTDTSFKAESLESQTQNELIFSLEKAVNDREMSIKLLQNELEISKQNYCVIENNYKMSIEHMHNKLTALNSELIATKEICANIENVKEDLELKFASNKTLLQKTNSYEEQYKVTEDRYSKLKALYTQMREEHINLLRQSGESTKLLNQEKRNNSDLKVKIEQQRKQLEIYETQANDKDEILKDNTELKLNIQKLRKRNEEICNDCKKFQEHIESLTVSNIENIGKLKNKSIELDELLNELKQKSLQITTLETSFNDNLNMLEKKNLEHTCNINLLQKDLVMKNNEIIALQQTYQIDTEVKSQKIINVEENLKTLQSQIKQKDVMIQNLIDQRNDIERKHEHVNSTLSCVSKLNEQNEIKHRQEILSLIHRIVALLQHTLKSKLNDLNIQPFDKAIKYINILQNDLLKIQGIHNKSNKNEYMWENVAETFIQFDYNFIVLLEVCFNISNITTNMDTGHDICNQMDSVCDLVIKLHESLTHTADDKIVKTYFETTEAKLCNIKSLIKSLMKSSYSNAEFSNLIEYEVGEMDKAVNEATAKFVEMLLEARSKDSDIKLEVNEKILNACTTLMECITILIAKSKALQEEIVSAGRGKTSVKEFYRRNNQWTEGLISASKSVAKGAHFLVDAANKAITNENNNNFELIVAAQEIAASTAQLVVASKVKASRDSEKLKALTNASRNVSLSTGSVIAIVKDCQQFDQSVHVDVSKLTLSQAKAMEMEIHVKVLELEQALDTERLKLALFRKNNYQNKEN